MTPYSSSLQWMFVTYGCVYGLGSSLLFSSYFLITAKNFFRRQSLAVGIVSVGSSIGVLILAPFLQLLIETAGWRVTYRIISAPFFVMACICGAVFNDPITDSSETTSQNCTVSLHESAMSAMEIGSVNVSFVEDFENSAIHRNRGKTSEERNRNGNYAECDSKKGIQMTNRSTSPHLEGNDNDFKAKNSKKSNYSGTSSKLLDFSVFTVPSYTVTMISLLLMNFGHYIPQIHLVSNW